MYVRCLPSCLYGQHSTRICMLSLQALEIKQMLCDISWSRLKHSYSPMLRLFGTQSSPINIADNDMSASELTSYSSWTLCSQQQDFDDFEEQDNILDGHRSWLDQARKMFAAKNTSGEEHCAELLQHLETNATAHTVFLKDENCSGFCDGLSTLNKQKVLAQMQVGGM